MSTQITRIFDSLRSEKKTALMPFITGGYPSLDVTTAAIETIAHAGASIIEGNW
ncbi:MAG: hypothetical protein EBY29_08580 [Planctomycetes bacterium]|nr:hypothetical protein [Planctomycetota bacterium]